MMGSTKSRRSRKKLERYAVYLIGLAASALVWVGVVTTYKIQANASYRDDLRNLINNARLFEENILRSIGEVDRTLRYLRRTIENHPEVIAERTLGLADIKSDVTVQAAFINSNGFMLWTSTNLAAKPIDLSDREHFRVHVNSLDDRLFMSRPLIGRASKRWSVQFSRRLSDKNGGFGGVVVASLDPAHFSELYGSIDLGPTSSIALIGDDGIVRSSGGAVKVGLGDDLSQDRIIPDSRTRHDGSYQDVVVGQPTRVVAFRRVRGHQLVVKVSVTKDQILTAARAELWRNATVAGAMTIVILVMSHWGARQQTSFKQAQLALLRSRRRAMRESELLRLTLENMTHGIGLVSKDGHFQILNAKAIELLDLPQDFIRRRPTHADVIDYLVARGEFAQGAILDGMTPLEFCTRQEDNGEYKTFERVRPNGTVLEMRTERLANGGFVRTFTDITQRRNTQQAITRIASEDALTGLANRRQFQQCLENYAWGGIGGAGDPETGSGLALLCLDLDHFKAVNDTLGHPVGDLLLKAVAARLLNSVRPGDLVARLGGDEFAVVIQPLVSKDQPEIVATRLAKALSAPYDVGGHRIHISSSIGIACAPRDGVDLDQLLQAADLALYAAKEAGRDTFKRYELGMAERLRVKHKIVTDLRTAIEADQLILHYQPLVSIATGDVTGFEALMRWQHPTNGMISPGEFIAVAEESGLIVPLGGWALRTASREAMSWPGNLKVAVNVSPLQFTNGDLITVVADSLASSGLPPHRLEIEITESTLMQDKADVLETLQRLREMGVGISMDDFGTGYSSLSYLRSFPLSKIKIDRSFVTDLNTAPDRVVIIQSIIEIAKTLKMTTTAEGVETGAQMAALREMGCHEAQGYLISRPVAACDIPVLLNRLRTDHAIAA